MPGENRGEWGSGGEEEVGVVKSHGEYVNPAQGVE